MKVELLSVAGDHLLGDNAMQPIAPRPTRPAALFRLAERAERGRLGSIQLLFLGSMFRPVVRGQPTSGSGVGLHGQQIFVALSC